VTERPILFSGPMVHELLAGTKTQTRRLVKNVPELMNERNEWCLPLRSPYGNVGDTLWVRETWAHAPAPWTEPTGIVYRACDNRTDYGGPWKPSIFMPRWASRITLRITRLRVERLQAISEADAIAEGCPAVSLHDLDCDSTPPSGHYAKLWDSINGKRVPWDLNPWVWVVCFALQTESRPRAVATATVMTRGGARGLGFTAQNRDEHG
jgi:hypothetical protein